VPRPLIHCAEHLCRRSSHLVSGRAWIPSAIPGAIVKFSSTRRLARTRVAPAESSILAHAVLQHLFGRHSWARREAIAGTVVLVRGKAALRMWVGPLLA